MKHRISVFGLGYVGTVLLGCLARDGWQVIGVDIDPVKQELLRNGNSPVIEEGMQELIADAMKSGRVEVTDDTAYAVRNSDISFTCVGTPSAANGSQNLTAVTRLAGQFGDVLKVMNQYHVFVIRSTVIPGTVEKEILPLIESRSGKTAGKDFGLCFQPEFLREGSSVKDYDNPPFTIVGGSEQKALDMVRDVFGNLPCDFIETDIPSAEMIKYCCNVFHALKITFANEVGRICRSFGIDSRNVMDMVCRDTRLNISPAYLKPGFAFGGSCLPKDLKGLLYAARNADVKVPMIRHILASNNAHIELAADMILQRNIRRVALVGLSFKGGTDDLRESPLVTMAETFIGKGIELKIYDPQVHLSRLLGANRSYIEATIPHIAQLMTDNCEEIITNVDAVVIGQHNETFMEALYSMGREYQFVLDLVGRAEPEKIKGEFAGICW